MHKVFGKSAVVQPGIMKVWASALSDFLWRYSPWDIYNADRTSLYYNLQPLRMFAVKHDLCKGRKRSNLLCYCAQIWMVLIK
jgi:hypothetical protein